MYFEIKIQARSPEELAKRVADNELRGFVVARYYDYTKDGTGLSSSKYRRSDGSYSRYKYSEVHKHYGAVMRRDNRDWMAQ